MEQQFSPCDRIGFGTWKMDEFLLYDGWLLLLLMTFHLSSAFDMLDHRMLPTQFGSINKGESDMGLKFH